ncbi:MAG: penicillin-binding protein 2 [Alphaproteobacteria bacterium]|nr:penicillin-binding protein 2 [Alphaproteobacteria bacterium]
MRRDRDRYRLFTRRAAMLGAGKVGLFGLLAARLYYLQVVESDRYTMLAEDNRISVRLMPPSRGAIVDRHGELLALNQQAFRVQIVPEQARRLEAVLNALGDVIEVPEHEIARVLRSARRQRAFVPITVREGLSFEEVSKVSLHAPELPGVQIDVAQSRFYPAGGAAAHVLGYVGAVAEADLTGEPVLTLPGFRIGKAGIERAHDLALRGRAGTSEVEVNAVGRVVRELYRREGDVGQELMLSIDAELQAFTAARFGDQTGAAVVMDVHTGEVLTLVSAPSFDPNLFSQGIRAEDWRGLINHPYKPLTNKAIAGQYSPGSTFKMVVAMAALEYGIATPSQTFSCRGDVALGEAIFHCWKKGGHGTLDMHGGIQQSCDVYFYELARRVGVERIAQMAYRLGFGNPLDIELPGEQPGIVPTNEWKKARIGVSWQLGETLVVGIGQGYLLATPLQLATMTARLVNGGRAVTPRLTRRLGSAAKTMPAPAELGFQRANLATIERAMAAVTGPGGTAYRARIELAGMAMGGKTGTSQVRRISLAERRTGVRKHEDLPREQRDHALFVGYAPIEAPRYAVAVIAEHGGGGASVAAPIARDVLIETQRRGTLPRGGTPQAAAPATRPGDRI